MMIPVDIGMPRVCSRDEGSEPFVFRDEGLG